jgi:SAM-dependent methyltransferase
MSKTKKWRGHVGTVCDLVGRYHVIECEKCGFRHIIPIPSRKELVSTYSKQYYSREKPLYLKRAREDLEWWNTVYSERYERLEKLLPRTCRRILDVGSGPGYFLLHGRQRGWITKGIEPSKQAVAHSRGLGLEIVEDFLTVRNAGRLGTFDVIHFSEVLEHVPDPKAMLEITKRCLAHKGLLHISVPNDYNPFQKVLREICGYKPWWIVPPHHINYFNARSLERLLVNSGFEVVMQTATFPIDAFLLMGDNYVGNDKLGRRVHQKRKTFEINLAKAGMSRLKRDLYSAMARLGIGREIEILARSRKK